MHTFQSENLKARNSLGNLGRDGRITSKEILKIYGMRV
jgi:hypothetical protein